jgi:hypothetical protein
MSKKQTVVFDIETMKAITETATQYQLDLINTLGFKRGEMAVFSAGRRTGKSYYYDKVLKNRIYGTNLCNEIMLPLEPVQKPKYQFSRAKWHTVDIGGGGWRLSREYNEIIDWCNDTFGPHPKRSDAWSRWWVGIGQIYFRDEQDLVLYKLKWA